MIISQTTIQNTSIGLLGTGGGSGITIWITEHSGLIGLCFTGFTCLVGAVLAIINTKIKSKSAKLENERAISEKHKADLESEILEKKLKEG